MISNVRRLVIALVTLTLLTLSLSSVVIAKNGGNQGGNSAASAACENSGYVNFADAHGNLFANEGACVKYAAHGGQLATILTLSPASPWDAGDLYAFGSPQTATQTFTVANIGGLSTQALSIVGTAGRVSLSNDLCSSTSLAPGDTCQFDVTITSLLVGGINCGSGVQVRQELAITDPGHVLPYPYLRLNVTAVCH
jgi:phosphoribosylformylglycinamidine (FGAM) synthase-like enzyme